MKKFNKGLQEQFYIQAPLCNTPTPPPCAPETAWIFHGPCRGGSSIFKGSSYERA